MKAKVSTDLCNNFTDLKKLNKNDHKNNLQIGKFMESALKLSFFVLLVVIIKTFVYICTLFIHSVLKIFSIIDFIISVHKMTSRIGLLLFF